MLAHLGEFLGGKFPGFLQDGVRNAEFPNIVEQSRAAKLS
jgi:hypothetical protein